MIREAIEKIVSKQDLRYDEAYAVMNEIMNGETTSTQNAAFLAALSTKSTKAETIEEIAGCAAAMREHALPVDTGMDVFEIVGTGGDHAHSFNISTTAALVAAAGGVKVAKHGNRAASSQCGTADCLEALGGPLTNPGHPKRQLLGVYDEYLVTPLAQVLISLGVERAMVVYGQDRLDEISASAPTTVCECKNGWFRSYVITPEEFGLRRCDKTELTGGTPAENAAITRAILRGEERGAKRDAVLLNAGASLYINDKAPSMQDGITRAAELIDSGAADQTLDRLIAVSQR